MYASWTQGPKFPFLDLKNIISGVALNKEVMLFHVGYVQRLLLSFAGAQGSS